MTMLQWKFNQRRLLLTKVLFVLLNQLMVIGIYGKLCEVETGQNNIIVDIEESRGNVINTHENSPTLQIHGDVDDEITLGLNLPEGSHNLFKLNGKSLQLVHPLDRDKENLSHIQFSISCTIKSTPSRTRNIPIIVRVSDVNDEPPIFVNTPYETSIAESTPVGTTIYSGIKATDIDAGVNGAVEYFVVEGGDLNDTSPVAADGFGVFAIAYPHQGHVTVVKTLDYERVQRYYLTIVASDRARNVSERLSATTTLVINVEDVDDLDPSFIYDDCLFFEGSCINPEYTATIVPGTVQKSLEILPQPVRAIDLDALNASIRYEFAEGTPSSFNDYFAIDERSAEIRQVKLVDSSVAERQFVITIKAEEATEQRRFATAKLTINVKPIDVYPPVLIASSLTGVIEENAAVGTRVMSLLSNNPIKFGIKDEDYSTDVELPIYSFELTTNSFSVNKDGYLVVNDSDGIDRERSEKLLFQVIARERHGNAASSPLSVNITILDVNDNEPEIFEMQPVTVSAGSARRLLAQAIAKDIDAGTNASISFSLPREAREKFSIDSKSGEIFTVGRLNANENWNLTVRATDGGGLWSETNLLVNVIAGPNTKPPVFTKSVYEVSVNESSNIDTKVVQLQADDPETDPVKYSIMSGNDLRQFKINSESGAVTIIRKLDRETLTKYQLLVRAEDTGGLYTTAVVNVKVLDANDNPPVFDESTLPYLFSVDEGKLNAYVGMIQAYDIDEGANGDVVYSLPPAVPFRINGETGKIYTTEKLSFRKRSEYEFMVKASDQAAVPLTSEIRIKVSVKEIPSVLPVFNRSSIEVKIAENVDDAFVATVQISNADAVESVSYAIKKSSSREFFKINAKTGEIRTAKPLDFEDRPSHELIVGTMENDGRNQGDVVRVKILVEDRNDIAPVFLITPEPVSITDDQAVGSLIASMPAVDTDATSPGNVVRYEMTGKGKALKFFHIDPENGNIRIKDDLSKDATQQFEINVRAYDLGEPQLSAVSNLVVFVKHIQPQSHTRRDFEASTTASTNEAVEELGLAFGDETYVTNIPESTSVNATIKLIPIFNVKKSTRTKNGFACEIVAGNEMGIFAVAIEELACALKLREPLDFENKTTHELKIKIQSARQRINAAKSVATVKILVQDTNDNAPVFKFRRSGQRLARNDTYYGVVNYESMIGTTVLKVEAYDEDSGTFGLIKYRLVDEIDDHEGGMSKSELPSSYFIVTDTGVIRTRKPFNKAIDGHFAFKVEATDNYGKDAGVVHRSYARVIINVISDFHRLTVAIAESNPDEVQRYRQTLEDVLTERSNGLFASIEKFATRKAMTQNGSIIEVADSTDTWFYVLDPKTEKILLRNSSVLASSLLDASVQTQVTAAISRLVRSPVEGIFAPLETENEIRHLEISNSHGTEQNHLVNYSLISLAVVASIIVIIGGVYSFIWWNKYHHSKSSQTSTMSSHRNQLRVDNNKINQLQNVHAVQVNLKELIVAYDGTAR